MLRFKRISRNRISNRLALFAGLMLLVSALAGMEQVTPNQSNNSSELAGNHSTQTEQNVVNNQARKQANRKKGFKVSLFLFRLD